MVVVMNTLAYLQFFDRFTEKNLGTFQMERISSKCCTTDIEGTEITHRCNLTTHNQVYTSDGNSRKDALRTLYRQLRGSQ